MKLRFLSRESGQSIIELVLGLSIIVILCSAAIALTTTFWSWTKSNMRADDTPVATPPAVPTSQPVPALETVSPATEAPANQDNLPTDAIPISSPVQIESPIPSADEPSIPTAPSQTNGQEDNLWQRFLRWWNDIVKR